VVVVIIVATILTLATRIADQATQASVAAGVSILCRRETTPASV
jgi:hypothetical protein